MKKGLRNSIFVGVFFALLALFIFFIFFSSFALSTQSPVIAAVVTYSSGNSIYSCNDTDKGYMPYLGGRTGASVSTTSYFPFTFFTAYFQGTKVISQTNCTDTCSADYLSLMECSCSSTGIITRTPVACPMGCDSGACVRKFCVDTDGGFNKTVNGTVLYSQLYPWGNSTNVQSTLMVTRDFCVNTTRGVEMMCNVTNLEPYSLYFDCTGNTTCSSGRCIVGRAINRGIV